MKLKTLILTGCVALSMVLGGNAFAADMDGATIERIGVNPGVAGATTSSNIIFVKHSSITPSGGTLQCVLSSDLGDAGLATALTAQSLGKPVWLRVGSVDSTKVTTATIMYLNK